ncbi:DUF6273 domain-containing protein [Oribacterium sp. FC2011]|uniref:DUF6273 domain-containing protein n=1 Tax=Oribacterium sp. FC2011 TaxID=1408311 RepID=UPI0004E2141E|nr:DUF6273 domain-containing protein [Oribacterium sp. FC2011]
MAALQCEICGGKLIGKPGGIFECDSCGMEYSTEWAKAKIQEIKGTVKVEGTVQVEGTVKVEGGQNIDSLLALGFRELAQAKRLGKPNRDKAREYFEQALTFDAQNGDALLGVIMCGDAYTLFLRQNMAAGVSCNTREKFWECMKKATPEDREQIISGENFQIMLKAHKSTELEKEISDFMSQTAINDRMAADKENERKKSQETVKKELEEVRKQLKAITEGTFVFDDAETNNLKSLRSKAEDAENAVKKKEQEFDQLPEQDEKRRLVEEISKMQKQMTALGFFKGKEKKNLQSQIQILDEKLREIDDRLLEKKKELEQLALTHRTYQNQAESYLREIEQKNRISLMKRGYALLFGQTDIKPGAKVIFGRYKQGREDNMPIQWRVLNEDDGLLMITDMALEAGPLDYNTWNSKTEAVTWENCHLRKYLNNDFLKSAFSAEELPYIRKKTVTAHQNPKEGSRSAGKDTEDYVFLLSVEEAELYFNSDEDRICVPTEWAKVNWEAYEDFKTKGSRWWLRTPSGIASNDVAYVDEHGSINYNGRSAFYDQKGKSVGFGGANYSIRPAVWIGLES